MILLMNKKEEIITISQIYLVQMFNYKKLAKQIMLNKNHSLQLLNGMIHLSKINLKSILIDNN